MAEVPAVGEAVEAAAVEAIEQYVHDEGDMLEWLRTCCARFGALTFEEDFAVRLARQLSVLHDRKMLYTDSEFAAAVGEVSRLETKVAGLTFDNAELRQDRNEWEQATICANRRYERAEAERDAAVGQLAKVREVIRPWACCGSPGLCGARCMDDAESNALAKAAGEIECALAASPTTGPAPTEETT